MSRVLAIPEWTGDATEQAPEYKEVAEALLADRDQLLKDLRAVGRHATNCKAYKAIGRFGSRSGLDWSEGDEKTCDCILGFALRGGA